MKDNVSTEKAVTPMLFPFEPVQFWELMRKLIREEVIYSEKQKPHNCAFETTGMTYKPLYKIAEICSLFHVSKPTIYDWIKHGKLKPYKIRSGVYFLWQDIQQLLSPENEGR